MKEDYPIYVKWTKTLDWIMTTVERFPKNSRFTLSSRLVNISLDVLEGVIEAIYTTDRINILKSLNLYIEKLRAIFRICYERKYIFSNLLSYEKLLSAFKKAYKGSNKSREALKFYCHREQEILKLKQGIKDRVYLPSGYRIFKIHDPKERLISVAPFRDRVVHHAIVNIIEPIYEKIFIYDSYATRKDKGTHRAIKRTQEFIRKNKYYLRTDIHKYFDSVNHRIVSDILERKIKDRDLLWLIESIIKAVPTNKGLPIGNLTSQFMANVYLDPLDHFIKDHLGVKYYIRYMDDMVILSNNIAYLKGILQKIKNFIETKLELKLKENAVYINKRSNGITFIGARIFPNTLRINKKSLKRGLRKLEKRNYAYNLNDIADNNYMASLSSISGHISFFDSYKLRQSLGQALYWQ